MFLNESLSEKSQSSVFRGRFGDTDVAVKRVSKHNYYIDKKYVQCEHKTLAELFEHDNIVRYYDCQERHGMIFLALEFCESDLEKYVEHHRIPDPATSLDIASQMCCGLEYLHSKEFVHRDFKPANVLMKKLANSLFRVKICDMGISRKVKPGQQTYSETGDRGTTGYMPFEVLDAFNKRVRAQHLSFSVDIFSFAITLYFMLSGGEHPFGHRYKRDGNILDRKCPNLDSAMLSYEAKDLLPRMLNHCAHER